MLSSFGAPDAAHPYKNQLRTPRSRALTLHNPKLSITRLFGEQLRIEVRGQGPEATNLTSDSLSITAPPRRLLPMGPATWMLESACLFPSGRRAAVSNKEKKSQKNAESMAQMPIYGTVVMFRTG